jgi:hypothetical protein
MPWELGLISLVAAVGSGLALAGSDLWVMALLPLGSAAFMTVAAVQVMKLANRQAQRRIASGEYPEIRAIGAGQAEDAADGEGLPATERTGEGPAESDEERAAS